MIIIVVRALIVGVWLVVLGRALMSWIDPYSVRPVSQLLYRVTEPFLAPVREVLPKSRRFDLAPLVVLFGLGFVMRVTLNL
ncbi:MAG: YggT family protein [Chloroflexota bacterium]